MRIISGDQHVGRLAIVAEIRTPAGPLCVRLVQTEEERKDRHGASIYVWLKPVHLDIAPSSLPAHRAFSPLRGAPEESFRATELAASRAAPTRPELADADDGEERAVLHLHREELLTLARTRTHERDAARALLEQERREHRQTAAALLVMKARHRTAIGFLTDVDRASDRIAAFLAAEVKA